MSYVNLKEPSGSLNTMDKDEVFKMPGPIEGPIPPPVAFKSRVKYPRVFNYGTEENSRILDMYYYLQSPLNKNFLSMIGITARKYVSHADGVNVGK